jgi:two-component system, OmpR family, alkaline phosphatase synthesis response regulator PhoP
MMRKKHVLIVEDDAGLLLSLSDRLLSEGYSVQGAADAQSAYERAAQERFDLILLDLALPDGNGFDVCRDLRHEGVRAPILMLTAWGRLEDRVRGFKLGADDYLVKPFEPAELLARMEALFRRPFELRPATELDSYVFGSIHVDFVREQVLRAHDPIVMLPLEFKLLWYFIQHRGKTLTRARLLNDVWGHGVMPMTRTVDVHVAGLRRKIETQPRHPRYLLTVHHRGYRFVG